MLLMFQLLVTVIWGSLLAIHTRRLLRLARVEQLRRWDEQLRLRSGLNRIWWWLGQDEFWKDVRVDCVHCLQLTAMLFMAAWGVSQMM